MLDLGLSNPIFFLGPLSGPKTLAVSGPEGVVYAKALTPPHPGLGLSAPSIWSEINGDPEQKYRDPIYIYPSTTTASRLYNYLIDLVLLMNPSINHF